MRPYIMTYYHTTRTLFFWIVLAAALILLGSQTIQSSAAGNTTVPLAEKAISAEQSQAQTVALTSRALSRSNLSARTEVFQIAPLPNFRPNQRDLCATATCYQVDIYDYETGRATTVIVDITNSQILDIFQLENSHPMYSEAVALRAKALMINNAEVVEAVGRPIQSKEIMLMDGYHADVEGCDGRNLCLTNVFVVDSGNVWVTVNMQKNEVAGIWWTSRALDGAEAGRLKETESADTRGGFCNDTYSHTAGGWDVNYRISNTDGLYAYNISYQGETVVDSIKLVEWHADYTVQNTSGGGPTGFVDYTTCGVGSGSGFPIVAYVAPEIRPITEMGQQIGFEIVQDYRMSSWGNTCNYRYEQHYQFYNDGRWRVVGGSYGRGCGNAQLEEAVYRPVLRIDLTPAVTGEHFDYWDSTANNWTESTFEDWFGEGRPGHNGDRFPANSDGYAFRIRGGVKDYYIEPGIGQFKDGGTG
ncbi:MAG TPA: hypothetical protein ENJ56_07615, partial [Anaerolineae bacterium]|nr:hypothetical protein [Anaerolineae bacterium]